MGQEVFINVLLYFQIVSNLVAAAFGGQNLFDGPFLAPKIFTGNVVAVTSWIPTCRRYYLAAPSSVPVTVPDNRQTDNHLGQVRALILAPPKLPEIILLLFTLMPAQAGRRNPAIPVVFGKGSGHGSS